MDYSMVLAHVVRLYALALLTQWPLGVACLVALYLAWRAAVRSAGRLQRQWFLWLVAPLVLPIACLMLSARFVGAAPPWALLAVHLTPAFLVGAAVFTAHRNRRWIWLVVATAITHGWLLATGWWMATMGMTG
jgi:hypothetical protein